MAIQDYKDQLEMEDIYKISEKQYSNWYNALPYCFRVRMHNGTSFSFYLPINPSNLSISTHFATNVISTVYGTVEEHSEQRYFDIVIAGTTGMSPKYIDATIDKDISDGSRDDVITRKSKENLWDKIKKMTREASVSNAGTDVDGRSSYPVEYINTGGFFNRTKSLISNTINKAVDIFKSDGPYEGGVTNSKSGYVAFHNFYRFLLAHKKEVLGKNNNRRWGNNNHPIQFINYKDNNQYNVAIQTFQLTRSVDDPMLYKYNIVMRGYKLSPIDKPNKIDIDKKKNLGLDSVKSMSARAILSNGLRNAKNAAASAVGAAKGFGS